MVRRLIPVVFAIATVAKASVVLADEVIFANGDRLTGTIKSVDGGKLTIDTKVAGVVSVDMKDVQTFSTDAPVQMRLADKSVSHDAIAAQGAPATQPVAGPAEIQVGGKTIPVADVKRLNASQAWTGSILANFDLQRGNTHSLDVGVAADATLRRDDEFNNDRFSLGAAYNFGNQTSGGVHSTSTDNWFAQGKYDKFFTDQWYGYGVFRVDHDRLAFLDYRLSPGVGVGYQWIESADLNFSTEAGVSYVYESYSNDGTDGRVALRLAYHLDKALNEKASLFHNLEWLPAFEDPGDYNLNTDLGLKVKLTGNWFSEGKVVFQRDSTPAPGALKDDIRFVLGLGWSF